jgi:hypothetical protein
MTLPSEGRKLNKNEIRSITNAIQESGIRQVHPDKMEAYAEYLVRNLKGKDD